MQKKPRFEWLTEFVEEINVIQVDSREKTREFLVSFDELFQEGMLPKKSLAEIKISY